jgi:carbamoyl-phosphate synthase large subunit|tara:strand:- start:1812 stop:3722 length:1911 start_codon:yes stop_codon:yes gene_type:complete
MRKKRIFISGGSGVIGNELVKILESKNHIIFVGDIKAKPSNFSKKVLYYQGDLNFVEPKIIREFKPEIFIHLAASFERSKESYDFWKENFHNNINLSHSLMSIMKDLSSIKRIVFASSYLVYDPSQYLSEKLMNKNSPLCEDDLLNPRNLTGMAKLFHEKELKFLNEFKSKKFSTISVRIFRGYGKNSRDIISRWIRALILGKEIEVYRPEGKFDFIYAKDTAEGLYRIANNYKIKDSINLGSGKSRSISDVISILQKKFKKMKMIQNNKHIPFESSKANMDRFYKLTKWLPEYNLEKAIPEIINFEKRKKKELIKKERLNILITSSSKKIPLIIACISAAKKINKEIKIICGDINKNSISKYVSNSFWKMPITKDMNFQLILDGCLKRNIELIIPTRDQELLFWSKYKNKFKKNGIYVSISPIKTIKICNDKYLFSKFGEKNNLPLIYSGLQINEIKNRYYVVKERYGSGSNLISLKLSKKNAIEYAKKIKSPIYQPFINGKEISVDAWFDKKSKLIGLSLRERFVVKNGESQITKTFQNNIIERKFKKVFSHFKFCGPVVFQAIIDKKNIHIIECNPRFGGATTASINIGLDVFYWTIAEMLGISSDEFKFLRNNIESTQIRIPQDIYRYDNNI